MISTIGRGGVGSFAMHETLTNKKQKPDAANDRIDRHALSHRDIYGEIQSDRVKGISREVVLYIIYTPYAKGERNAGRARHRRKENLSAPRNVLNTRAENESRRVSSADFTLYSSASRRSSITSAVGNGLVCVLPGALLSDIRTVLPDLLPLQIISFACNDRVTCRVASRRVVVASSH